MFEEGEVLIILAFALLFLKPRELIELGRELGKLYREIKIALGEEQGEKSDVERLLDILSGEEGVREHGESSSSHNGQETVVSSFPTERREE